MLVCGQVLLIDGVLPSSRVDRLNEVAGDIMTSGVSLWHQY